MKSSVFIQSPGLYAWQEIIPSHGKIFTTSHLFTTILLQPKCTHMVFIPSHATTRELFSLTIAITESKYVAKMIFLQTEIGVPQPQYWHYVCRLTRSRYIYSPIIRHMCMYILHIYIYICVCVCVCEVVRGRYVHLWQLLCLCVSAAVFPARTCT